MDTNVHSRLKQERKRLKLKQRDVAELCDVAVKTVGRWEKNVPIPSDKAGILAEVGADVGYILTGHKRADLKLSDSGMAPYEITKKTDSYGKSAQMVRSRPQWPSSGAEVDPDNRGDELDQYVESVVDKYMYGSLVEDVIESVELALQDKHQVVSPRRKARLIRAAVDGWLRLKDAGEEQKFGSMLIALVDATLADTEI